MKLEELKITITRIEESTDKEGCLFLKCKGYNTYKVKINGKRLTGFNSFTSIRLYPVDEQQYTETKERLFSQTVEKPKLQVVCYENDLTTNIIGGKICPILTVLRYDFVKDKLFNKKTLLRIGKGE